MADLSRPSPQRRTFAADPGTPPKALTMLAGDANIHVRRAAAANPNTPRDVLALLRRAGSSPQLTAFASPNDVLERDEFTRLATLGPWGRLLAARHSGTPTELLDDILFRHGVESTALRQAIARHPRCAPRTLSNLCVDRDPEVRRTAGEHAGADREQLDTLHVAGASTDLTGFAEPRALPPERLTELARRGPWGRVLASRHPDSPESLLRELTDDESPEVRAGLASNAKADEDLLRRIADPIDPQTAGLLAAHPATPPDILDRLAELAEVNVRVRVAAHPRLFETDELPLRLALDGSSAVRETVADRRGLSEGDRALLAAAGAGTDLLSFAKPDPSLSAGAVSRLAKLGGWGRHLAARHPSTSADTLAALLTDADPMIRLVAARHDRRPQAFVRLLIRAGSDADLQGFAKPLPDPPPASDDLEHLARLGPWARHLVARHPATPRGCLHRLTHDEAPTIRSAVARHAEMASTDVARLAQDPTPDVRWAIARREDLDHTTLSLLARDPIPSIRLAVLRYADAAPDLVDRLRNDLDADVRAAAVALATG